VSVALRFKLGKSPYINPFLGTRFAVSVGAALPVKRVCAIQVDWTSALTTIQVTA
jgi:hypothetical protein